MRKSRFSEEHIVTILEEEEVGETIRLILFSHFEVRANLSKETDD